MKKTLKKIVMIPVVLCGILLFVVLFPLLLIIFLVFQLIGEIEHETWLLKVHKKEHQDYKDFLVKERAMAIHGGSDSSDTKTFVEKIGQKFQKMKEDF